MRPKFLEIEGLQSFREMQTIDFDSLGETGLFGIFGPTGSGKSTVLDAITFVLYGKVKRAERGTQGIINTGRKTAKVSFTFELFKGNGRKTYRVERTYQRKKGSENSCEPKIARLIEVTAAGEMPLCDRAKEVGNSIEELLGLSHDDFTRAVVLPQNSFQEFLRLDNAKKRDMLERIFYLEEYGRQLQEKLSGKITALKSRVAKVRGALSMLEDASDQALAETVKALESAALEKKQVEKEQHELEAQFNETKEVWQLVQSLDQIRKKEQQHLFIQEEIRDKRILLEKAGKADGLLEMIVREKLLSGKFAETVKGLEEVSSRMPLVAVGLEETRGKYDGLKKEAEVEKPRLVALKTRLSDALGFKTELNKLEIKINELSAEGVKLQESITLKNKNLLRETGEVDAAEQKIKLLKEQMEPLKTDPEKRYKLQEGVRLENEVESLGRNVGNFQKKIASLNKIINAREEKSQAIIYAREKAEKAVEVLNLEKQKHEEAKPEDRPTALKYREGVYQLQTTLDVLKLKKSELEAIQGKIRHIQALSAQNAEKLGNQEEKRRKAGVFYEQCRLRKEKAVKELEKNTAYLLSKNLQEGAPCPVCGSEHHPSPAVQSEGTEQALLEQQLTGAEKNLSAAEKALKDAENNCLITSEQLKSLDEQGRQLTAELAAKNAEYEEAAQKLPAGLRELELPRLSSELAKMNTAGAEKLRAFDEWEEKMDELKSNLLKLGDKLSAYKVEENGMLAELKVNLENREQMENELQEALRVYNEKLQQYRLFLDTFKIKSGSHELKRLAENDRKINRLQREMEKMQELLGKKRVFMEEQREEVSALSRKSIKVEADRNNYLKQREEKVQRLKALAGDLHIEDEIARIKQKLEEYVNLDRQYAERLKDLEREYHHLLSQQTTLENQKKIYAESLEGEQKQLESVLLERGFVDRCEVEKSILPQEKQEALRAEISRYDETAKEIETEKKVLLKKLDSRNINKEEWEMVSSAFQEKNSARVACVSRYEVARNTLEFIKNKHDKWVVLQQSFRALTHKLGLFEQIQKLLRAEKGKENSFIDFIAEERLRYVAAKASETLGLMTKYKYGLELDSEAGFIIRDNANGGVHRMVTSLSGGETFLTSLSLALALSEQIQLKGQSPLEFFFLDEGFGTLDNDLLDMVMDSLERLSRKERVIGLISHVPELRSRMARRLIVEPPSYTGAGSRVKIEKG